MKWLPTIDDPKVKGSCCLFSIDNNGIVGGYKYSDGKKIPGGNVDLYSWNVQIWREYINQIGGTPLRPWTQSPNTYIDEHGRSIYKAKSSPDVLWTSNQHPFTGKKRNP